MRPTRSAHAIPGEVGVIASPGSALRRLHATLGTWAAVAPEFFEDDPPWTHIERGKVSLLRGAARRAGAAWFALEKFSIRREYTAGIAISTRRQMPPRSGCRRAAISPLSLCMGVCLG